MGHQRELQGHMRSADVHIKHVDVSLATSRNPASHIFTGIHIHTRTALQLCGKENHSAYAPCGGPSIRPPATRNACGRRRRAAARRRRSSGFAGHGGLDSRKLGKRRTQPIVGEKRHRHRHRHRHRDTTHVSTVNALGQQSAVTPHPPFGTSKEVLRFGSLPLFDELHRFVDALPRCVLVHLHGSRAQALRKQSSWWANGDAVSTGTGTWRSRRHGDAPAHCTARGRGKPHTRRAAAAAVARAVRRRREADTSNLEPRPGTGGRWKQERGRMRMHAMPMVRSVWQWCTLNRIDAEKCTGRRQQQQTRTRDGGRRKRSVQSSLI